MRPPLRAWGLTLGLCLAAREAPAQAPDGQGLYRQHCRTCHGLRGTPSQDMKVMFKNLPSLSDSTFLAKRSQDSMLAVLDRGLGGMPPFKGRLTPAEMAAVAEYVRTLPSSAPPP